MKISGGLDVLRRCIRSHPLIEEPVVYILVHDKEVVYVGQSNNIISRLRDHRDNKKFNTVYYLRCKLDHDVGYVEKHLISFFQPKYNKQCTNNRIDFKTMSRVIQSLVKIDDTSVESEELIFDLNAYKLYKTTDSKIKKLINNRTAIKREIEHLKGERKRLADLATRHAIKHMNRIHYGFGNARYAPTLQEVKWRLEEK